MKPFRVLVKGLLLLLLLPVGYVALAFLLTAIPVNRQKGNEEKNQVIYLSTNGVHLNIILATDNLSEVLRQGLRLQETANYHAFGWGDENFYLNTPTWADLTAANAIRALFLKSSTLMHVSRYQQVRKSWVQVAVSEAELAALNQYIAGSFQTDAAGQKYLLAGKGYGTHDDFYKARGSYSCLNTCNSWANEALATSGLTACYWTPFDFGVLNKYAAPS